MEEFKIQRLHDSLSKLRKTAGLGTDSQYRFGGVTASAAVSVITDKDGKTRREDGLPINALYSNFLKQGNYDPNSMKTSNKYGDGRNIKRNFDDCVDDGVANTKRTTTKEKTVSHSDKMKKKAEEKAFKKAKKKAIKLAEKKREKLKAKRKAKKAAKQHTNEQTGAKPLLCSVVDTTVQKESEVETRSSVVAETGKRHKKKKKHSNDTGRKGDDSPRSSKHNKGKSDKKRKLPDTSIGKKKK